MRTTTAASTSAGVAAPRTGIHDTAAYRADIDGLRAVAVLAVVIHHIAPGLLPGGFVGVDVFFVISGFLITRILRTEISEQRFSFANFYARRARRILPALFAVLGATLAVGFLIQLPSDYRATLRAAVAAVFSVSNVLFWHDREGYFDATDERLNPLLHTWSLGVEEQFYLFFPPFLLLYLRLGRPLQKAVLLLLGLASLGLAALLVKRFPTEVFYLLPFRAWELAVGAALALGLVAPASSATLRQALVLGGLAAIGWSCLAYGEATDFPGLSALAPVLGAAAVIHGGSGAIGAQFRPLTWRPVVYTGLISYSLYLWHWPLIVLLEYSGLASTRGDHALLVLASSFVLAGLSYHFIERPFRTPAARGRGWRVALALSAAAGISVFAVMGESEQGFRARFPAQILALDDARSEDSPFMDCFQRPVAESCVLGDERAPPDALLWGDSHALSWAPAIDAGFRKAGRSALLVSTAGCPPMLSITNHINPRCATVNREAMAMLQEQRELRTVLLAGYWSTYFRSGGPIQYVEDRPGAGRHIGADGATRALQATVARLLEHGADVVLIGPVPTYERNVPAALAMQAASGRSLLDASNTAQRAVQSGYFEAVKQLRPDGKLRLLNPMDWLCTRRACRVSAAGIPLYRDAHHLNVHGAMTLAPRLWKEIQESPQGTGRAAATDDG